MSVLVSINCLTYNHENYIADAIDSFLMQKTNFDFEIVIGEDCSTDNTKKIVEEYAKQHPNKIRIITSAQNVGMRKNSIRVLENSRGKYIAECEGDDYWLDPYKLQKQIDYMVENPDCTLCFHSAEVIQSSGKKTGDRIRPYRQNQVSQLEDLIAGGGGFCHTASLVYPKKLMLSPPAFYQTAHVGDYAMQIYLASQGSIYYFDECMSAYRIGVSGSWSSRMSSEGDKIKNMIRVHEGDIQLLHGFNRYTQFAYQHVVDKMIVKHEFILQVLKGEITGPLDTKYKEYIATLGIKKKLKMYAVYLLPKTYVRLIEMKRFT